MKNTPTKEAVISLVKNYASCSYPLSFSQILTLIPIFVDEPDLSDLLNDMVMGGELVKDKANGWFTIPDSAYYFSERVGRKTTTEHKLGRIQFYIKLIAALPYVKCAVLTGSCALKNARDDDDVDLMIITSPHTVFLCRIYATLLTLALRLHRKRGERLASGLVCNNIWIDGANMVVPPQKRGVYSARELVNVAVLINKDEVWEKFLSINSWVINTLPNLQAVAKKTGNHLQTKIGLLGRLNLSLGCLQLWYMKPHVTNEFISHSQLWLHPQVRS